MDEFKRKYKIFRTTALPFPNEYVKALMGELNGWSYSEEQALDFKGKWHEEVFSAKNDMPLDLEIGTGNGFHFAHHAKKYPERLLLGLELKYKPLIQSIRRARTEGSENARMARFKATVLDYILADNEVQNVIIHHPDPWLKKSQKKNRLIQDVFMKKLSTIQKENGIVDFKTDNENYYDWALEVFKNSSYSFERETRDLHNSPWAEENFITAFERIFLVKGQPIFYCRLKNTY